MTFIMWTLYCALIVKHIVGINKIKFKKRNAFLNNKESSNYIKKKLSNYPGQKSHQLNTTCGLWNKQ